MSPPYLPTTAGLGGAPTISLDVPICAVFLFLYILGAIFHMTFFQLNMRRGHKFIISGLMFGFCMARNVTCTLRIVWACYPTNIRLAIAAQVFVAAGVILLFIINLLFAQRILRAQHPNAGWHPIAHFGFIAIYVLIVVTLAMLITSVIQSFYTLNLNTRRIDRDIQLYGQTFYTIVSFLPIPIALLSLAFPRKQRTEKFGEGRFRHKIYILLLASTLLCLGATYRLGTSFKTPVPRSEAPAYFSKGAFYAFNFGVEILVIFLYVVVRVDKRFWIPNNSHKAGDYGRGKSGSDMLAAEEKNDLAKEMSRGNGKIERHIGTEEEVFDDMSPEEVAEQDRQERKADEEKALGKREPTSRFESSATTAIATPEPRTALATPDTRLSIAEKPETPHITHTPALEQALVEETDPTKV